MITDVVPSSIPLDNVFIPAIANGLASLGRFEDTYMVHAAKGETVIPKEVLDANPGLKEDLFQQMVDMGIENPERYVVGESLNSINPVTGQPEFFFDSIKSFFKKAAPIIGGVIGGAVGGPLGAAVGSGLGSKVAGQSTEQALLNAALSGGTSFLLGGGLSGDGKGITGNLFNFAPGDPSTTLGGLSQGISEALPSSFQNIIGSLSGAGQTQGIAQALGGGLGSLASGLLTEGGETDQDTAARVAAQAQRREVVGAGIRDREIAKGNRTLAQFGGKDISNLTPEELSVIRETRLNQRPTFRTAPARAVAAVPSAREQDIINRMLAGENVAQRQFPLDVSLQDITPPTLNAQEGGAVPGNRALNQDTVPAMLTPGEFVFTQDAVRGAAPNGSRQQQVRAMYDIMRGLEGRA